MQPQGHVQVATALLDHHLDAQAACALPRFRVVSGRDLCLEEGIPPATARALARLGHRLVEQPGEWAFGGAQVVRRHADGHLEGGSDPRKDGHAGRA
jgi:gamma-glutamyltranspeptidase/glutathione hydrolase